MPDERRNPEAREGMNIDPFARTDRTNREGLNSEMPTRAEPATDSIGGIERRPERPSDNFEATPAPKAEPARGTAAIAEKRAEGTGALVEQDAAAGFRSRWEQYQQGFVDEPKAAVESADELVAEVMQTVASQFAATREALERQWDRGDEVSTEDLRLAMQHYREFFNRLLAA